MQKALYYIVIFIACVFFVAMVTGYFVDENYQNEETLILDYEPRNIIGVLSEIENYEEGKSDVISVDLLGKYLNLYAWRENLKSGGFRRYRQVEKTDNKIVIEMTESSYGVTGIWEFEIVEERGDSLVYIREKSNYESILRRGFYFYLGMNKETTDWIKFIRVRLFKRLLTTP